MKDIFERLFNGEIYPGEKAVPKTDVYREDLHKLETASAALNAVLDERQKKLLKEMLDCWENVKYHEYVCIYGEGVRFGVELTAELYHMDRNGPPIPPKKMR